MKLFTAKGYKSEFHVGEETYTLKFVKKIPGGNAADIGLCDPEERTIYVKKGLSKALMFRTVVHELLHSIEFEYEIKIKHETIYQLEKALVDTLLMNF